MKELEKGNKRLVAGAAGIEGRGFGKLLRPERRRFPHSYVPISIPVEPFTAACAQSNQVQMVIGALLAPQFFVMDSQVQH
jgi:hypothetical protein